MKGYRTKFGDDRSVWVSASDDEVFVEFNRPAGDDDPPEELEDGRFLTRLVLSHDAVHSFMASAIEALNNADA